jgi:hypothetical protein
MKTAGAPGGSVDTRLGMAERALNEPRNLTSTTATSKTTLQITTKNREETNNKGRHKNLTATIWFTTCSNI